MSSILIVIILLAVGGLLPGCAIVQRALPGVTMSDANVVDVLNRIGESEIDAGRLARQRAATAEVQAFAGRVVKEHGELVERNRHLAQIMDVRPNPPSLALTLRRNHEEAMDQLRSKSGPEFDRAYIQHEIAMHIQAFGLLEAAAESEDDPSLKQYLIQVGPDLLSHLSAAKAVERRLVAQPAQTSALR